MNAKMLQDIFVEDDGGDGVEETADGCGDGNSEDEIKVDGHTASGSHGTFILLRMSASCICIDLSCGLSSSNRDMLM